jgi:Response regulator containing a CheY-like receiver domain and a GGDEF domain
MTKLTPTRNLVLYADDDQDDLLLIEQSFAQYSNNVEVVTFPDGNHTMHYLQKLTVEETSPCLIILDVNMPGLTGKEILVRIRELPQYRETPVVLFSTSSLPLDKEFALRYDAGFITKPIDMKQMEAVIYEFIDHCDEEIKKKIRKQTI